MQTKQKQKEEEQKTITKGSSYLYSGKKSNNNATITIQLAVLACETSVLWQILVAFTFISAQKKGLLLVPV